MRFLLDESADYRLSSYLTEHGHDVTAIARDYPHALSDQEVLSIAHHEERILIVNDRDFGELVFQMGFPHSGVIHFRLGDYSSLDTKIERLSYVLTHYADRLDEFIVVTMARVRARHRR